MTYNAEALPRRAKLREARRGRGNGGESYNSDQERAGYRFRSGSSPSHQPSPAGDDKAFGVAPNWPDCLGATAAYRTGAYNRCGLRCSRCTVRRHRRAALCRDLWSSGCLSRTRCCLATDAAVGRAPLMKTATRRSPREVMQAPHRPNSENSRRWPRSSRADEPDEKLTRRSPNSAATVSASPGRLPPGVRGGG